MRRDIIIHEIEMLLNDLSESGMVAMFERGLEVLRSRGNASENLRWTDIGVIIEYSRRAADYTIQQNYILDVLGLEALSNSRSWQEQSSDTSTEFIYLNHQKINQALTFCPKFLKLIKRESDELNDEIDVANDVLVQRIILTDEGKNLSSPQRIIELLQSIEQIYLVICEAHQMRGQKIAIVAIDSGSEKSFDFLGIAKLMYELRETLQSVYNMVSFHKQNVSLKNLQVAGETLAVVDQISKLEQSEAISAEEATRMKHSLFVGLEKFAGTGAYTPEMNVVAPVPSLVMRPQPRLLTGPADSIVREANEHEAVDGANVKANNGDTTLEDIQKNDLTDAEIMAAIKSLRSRPTSTITDAVKRPHLTRPKKPK